MLPLTPPFPAKIEPLIFSSLGKENSLVKSKKVMGSFHQFNKHITSSSSRILIGPLNNSKIYN